MTRFLGSLLLLPALTLVGCGGGDDDGTTTDSGVTSDSGTTSDSGDVTEPTVHVVGSPGMYFDPTDLTIAAGDIVRFEMTATHNAVEVSKETYDAREETPLEGGFQVGFAETKEVTFSEPGMHYYVCQPHVQMDMIGTITVE